MSILIDAATRALVQGITGATARVDTERCLRYGTRIVAGVSPGKGGEAQYQEVDGDIGLLVGGGGAGLYLHDAILELGGRPANHCVTPPTGSDSRKLKEVLRAIFDNPRLRGLLVGFNFAQMARADIRVRALVDILREKRIDTTRLPIVIRLFGPGEEEARRLAAEFPGITYLPRGASLRQAAECIVALTKAGVEAGR